MSTQKSYCFSNVTHRTWTEVYLPISGWVCERTVNLRNLSLAIWNSLAFCMWVFWYSCYKFSLLCCPFCDSSPTSFPIDTAYLQEKFQVVLKGPSFAPCEAKLHLDIIEIRPTLSCFLWTVFHTWCPPPKYLAVRTAHCTSQTTPK